MSIIVSHDVQCDHCGNWIHGCTSGNATEARRVAALSGWDRRLSPPKLNGIRRMVDLCVECLQGVDDDEMGCS